ncbi:threonine synthase [Oceanomicrobium pacificus]|uniref:Threonine synthase n=1 Tax=Oceanomicrobium pacificus TaxID=2692916 RepID=A0A6B0TYT7_9RHOB|nr:threonine synthase [Oceanomicrobium pacificus]MXU66855.1 threonine synthase [Oceanomicrobium pacificus]
MKYVSTRGAAPDLNFEEAMLTGLARDGGLYVPESWPQMSTDEIAALAGLSYEEVAFRVMRPFIGDTFTDAEFRDIIARAYASFGHAARVPLSQLDPNLFLMELHHGPTLAFKDVAMQLIGQMFQVALARRGQRVTIVGATSGDTGSAAIEAFRGLDAVDVFILFPDGRVSDVQRRQMTTPSEANVHALAVKGDFDDCQARLKDMFNDFAFRDAVGLAGVNSINWARVLAQVVYYFTAAVSLGAPHRKVSFTVPTGNFGDIFAGYVAKRMGLPIDRLVIATNRNDILHRTLETGRYQTEGVTPSISPSMDIQVSSNFERLLFDLYDREGAAVDQLMSDLKNGGSFALSQGAVDRLREEFDSGRADEDETRATITRVRQTTGQIVCPHTAVGIKVAADRRGDPSVPMVVLATAHAAKFPDAVEAATGLRPALPPRMADLFDRPERVTQVDNDLAALQATIREGRRA